MSVAARVAMSSRRSAALQVGFGPVLFRIAVAAIYAFLLGPILIIIATSFDPTTAAAFPPKGFTLHWYGEFLRSDNFTDAFKFSLYLGVLASIAATAIGFVTAYAIVRCLGKRRELGQSLVLLPAVIPQILISISLLLVLSFVPFPPFGALLAGHVVICLPFAIAGISASLDGVDEQLEAAALTLGASRLVVLREIVVPLAAPGILSALVFAFIVSFGDVYIALFLSGPGMTTLPVEIFSYMQWESTPVVAAITTLQVVMIIALGLLVERFVGLRKMMRF
jgi:putative spermidine/putrescine transport system permease protein